MEGPGSMEISFLRGTHKHDLGKHVGFELLIEALG